MTRRALTGLLLAAALWLAVAPARAQESRDLYTANAIVTGTDMRQRPWGFAQCLAEVLAKVAGNPRLKDDPRVVALAEHAGRFVVSFDYLDLMAHLKKNDDQGSYDRPHRLTVHFNPAKIDAELTALGEKPWRGPRPVVVPVLLVRGPRPPPYFLDAETPRGAEQRGSFATWADAAGLSVRFPSDIELAAWNAGDARLPAVAPASSDGEVIVIGTLDWQEALPGWVGSWRMRWRNADHDWGVGGVNYDAAFRDLLRGVMLLASGNGLPDRAHGEH